LKVTSIALFISGNLVLPEIRSRGWQFEQMTFMTVPKTPLNLYDRSVPREYYVWFSGKAFIVQAKAITQTM